MEAVEKTGKWTETVAAAAPPLRSKRKPTPTEFAETFLAGIARTGATGTFLVSYRGGRPIRIREVNNLQ